MGTGKMLGKPNKLRGSDLQWAGIPTRESRYTSSRFMLQKPRSAPEAMSQSWLQGFTFSPKRVLRQLIKIDIIIENPFPTSTKILYLGISTLFSYGLICIDQGFLGGFRKLTSITFSVELHFVIFRASLSMTDATLMCICPCNPTSTIYYFVAEKFNIWCNQYIQHRYILLHLNHHCNQHNQYHCHLSSCICRFPCGTSSTSYRLKFVGLCIMWKCCKSAAHSAFPILLISNACPFFLRISSIHRIAKQSIVSHRIAYNRILQSVAQHRISWHGITDKTASKRILCHVITAVQHDKTQHSMQGLAYHTLTFLEMNNLY